MKQAEKIQPSQPVQVSLKCSENGLSFCGLPVQDIRSASLKSTLVFPGRSPVKIYVSSQATYVDW
jgi:hypothetical protein